MSRVATEVAMVCVGPSLAGILIILASIVDGSTAMILDGHSGLMHGYSGYRVDAPLTQKAVVGDSCGPTAGAFEEGTSANVSTISETGFLGHELVTDVPHDNPPFKGSASIWQHLFQRPRVGRQIGISSMMDIIHMHFGGARSEPESYHDDFLTFPNGASPSACLSEWGAMDHVGLQPTEVMASPGPTLAFASHSFEGGRSEPCWPSRVPTVVNNVFGKSVTIMSGWVMSSYLFKSSVTQGHMLIMLILSFLMEGSHGVCIHCKDTIDGCTGGNNCPLFKEWTANSAIFKESKLGPGQPPQGQLLPHSRALINLH